MTLEQTTARVSEADYWIEIDRVIEAREMYQEFLDDHDKRSGWKFCKSVFWGVIIGLSFWFAIGKLTGFI